MIFAQLFDTMHEMEDLGGGRSPVTWSEALWYTFIAFLQTYGFIAAFLLIGVVIVVVRYIYEKTRRAVRIALLYWAREK